MTTNRLRRDVYDRCRGPNSRSSCLDRWVSTEKLFLFSAHWLTKYKSKQKANKTKKKKEQKMKPGKKKKVERLKKGDSSTKGAAECNITRNNS